MNSLKRCAWRTTSASLVLRKSAPPLTLCDRAKSLHEEDATRDRGRDRHVGRFRSRVRAKTYGRLSEAVSRGDAHSSADECAFGRADASFTLYALHDHGRRQALDRGRAGVLRATLRLLPFRRTESGETGECVDVGRICGEAARGGALRRDLRGGGGIPAAARAPQTS